MHKPAARSPSLSRLAGSRRAEGQASGRPLYLPRLRHVVTACTLCPLASLPLPLPAQLGDGRTLRSVHIEVRAQVPSPGQGLLASCLLEPVSDKYGPWPQSGEVS